MRLSRVTALLCSVPVVLASAGIAAAAKRPPGDPPGNNGTLKVVASDPSDPDPGNEPHVDVPAGTVCEVTETGGAVRLVGRRLRPM